MVDQKDYFEIFFAFRISRKFISMPTCSEWVEQERKSHEDKFRNWERCNWICVIGRSIDRSFVRTWCGSLTWGSHRVQWKRKNVWTWHQNAIWSILMFTVNSLHLSLTRWFTITCHHSRDSTKTWLSNIQQVVSCILYMYILYVYISNWNYRTKFPINHKNSRSQLRHIVWTNTANQWARERPE